MANILTIPESGIFFDGNTAGTGIAPILTGDASGVAIQYDGYAGVEINSSATGANYLDRFSVEGANGRLFGVTDEVTGTVFSVNDAAGLPIIEVESTSSHDKITIGEYGTNALVVSGDKIGIGIDDPSAPLDIESSQNIVAEFRSTDNRGAIVVADDDTSIFLVAEGSKASLGLNSSLNAGNLNITSSGEVGIGTTSPAAKLHAYNSAGGDATDKAGMLSEAVMKLQPHASNSTNMLFAQVNSGNGIGIQVTNGPATANWDIALSPFGGNVGIGTTSPNARLELKGSTADSSANAFVARDSASAGLFSIRNDGRVDAAGDLVIGGNLTVNGTTSTINSTTLQVDDKNIELGTVATPTDTTADGGGITLLAGSNESDHKTIKWINSTDAWTFNTNVSASGLDINGAADISGHLEVGEYILRSGQGSNYHRFLASRQIFVVGNASSIDLNNGTSTFGATGGATTLQGSSLLLDSAADITIDAGGQDIILSDDETIFGTLSNSSGFQIRSRVNNADLLFRGVDDGTEFTALTLDMSAGGNATFAGNITLAGPSNEIIKSNGSIRLNIDSNADQSDRIFIVSTGANSELFRVDESGNGTFGGSVTAPSLSLASLNTQNSEETALVINDSYEVGTRELGSAAFSATSAFAAASHTHAASDITSGTLNADRLPRPTSGDWWNGGAVIVGTDGVMEVGKYLDFHVTDAGTSDYDVRVTASSSAISVGGSVTATSLIKSGGTSSQFLKADGSVDSNTYLTTGSASSTYLPLAGGTLSGGLTLNGDVTFGGTAKKVIINSKRNVSLPAIGTKMRILTLSDDTFIKVFIISSENSYVEPIELDIHYKSAGGASPVIHRVNNYTWHVHSNDIAFSSDSSGHVYMEKLSYTTGRNVRIHIVEQYQGSASLLDGSTTTTTNTGSDESNIGKFGIITAGTWNGGVISSAYLDTDTAHLTGTQTFTGAKTFGNITSSGGYKANIAESSDADNITSNNIKYGYLNNAASNKPVSGNSQYASVGNITLTHLDTATNDDFYIRAKAYNGNTSWAKIFTDQNSSFLPLAGGTISGKLLLNSASYDDHLSLRRGIYGYDTIVTGTRIDYSPTADTDTFKFLADLQTTGNLTVSGNATVAGDLTVSTDFEAGAAVNFSALANADSDVDKFLVSDSGDVKFRTGSEVLSDIGGITDVGGKITKKISGDGTATTFAVTHSFGTPHVMTQLLHYGNNGTGATYEVINATVKRNSDNAIDVIFGVAPTTSEDYLVLITKMPAIS